MRDFVRIRTFRRVNSACFAVNEVDEGNCNEVVACAHFQNCLFKASYYSEYFVRVARLSQFSDGTLKP